MQIWEAATTVADTTAITGPEATTEADTMITTTTSVTEGMGREAAIPDRIMISDYRMNTILMKRTQAIPVTPRARPLRMIMVTMQQPSESRPPVMSAIILLKKVSGGFMGRWYARRLFPRLEELVTSGLGCERRRLIAHAQGHTLEIGAGAGQNMAHLPAAVERYVALEPSASFIGRLRRVRRRNSQRLKIFLLQGRAECLPYPSETFDSVVSFLVLCSVGDPVTSLKEIHRVLKPSGRFLFFEHVLADKPLIARRQSFLNPLWKRIACGCELVRDTSYAIQSSGFRFQNLTRYHCRNMGFSITAQVIEGVATKIPRDASPDIRVHVRTVKGETDKNNVLQ